MVELRLRQYSRWVSSLLVLVVNQIKYFLRVFFDLEERFEFFHVLQKLALLYQSITIIVNLLKCDHQLLLAYSDTDTCE